MKPAKTLFNDLYEIEGVIGRGDASIVYKAKDVYNTNQPVVALKVLVSNQDHPNFFELKQRLRNEALCLISTNNKFVVKLIDFQVTNDVCYLVTEFAPYLDLKFYLESQDRVLTHQEAKTFIKQILIALDHVHNLGIIHRDVRPENILVFGKNLVKLGDFSNSISISEPIKQEDLAKVPGSWDYLPPEAFSGFAPSFKWDLYSLGVTFLELIRGRNPFEGLTLIQSVPAREQLANESFDDLPFDLRYTIKLLLQFDPIFRPKSAKEALSYLENPELAETKIKNLVEVNQNQNESELGKTIVLSEEELALRVKESKPHNILEKLKARVSEILNQVSFRAIYVGITQKLSVRLISLVVLALIFVLFIFNYLSRETTENPTEKEWRAVQFVDIPDGIYYSKLIRVIPPLEEVEAVLIKWNGKIHISTTGDFKHVSSSPISSDSLILSILTQTVRVSDLKTSNNLEFAASTINLDNNLTGVIYFKFLSKL